MAERMVLCGPVRSDNLPVADRAPLRLSLWEPDRNVRLCIADIRRGMLGDIPTAFRDLIEVATYVYAADQAVPRGSGTDQDLGAAWRRRLFFRIPVRCLDLWSDPAVRTLLVESLSFLTEDEYDFQFEPLKVDPPPFHSYFEAVDGPADGRAEEVVLFSGGTDSLGGVVREAVTLRRQVLLVHHRAASKRVPRHEALLQALREHPGVVPPWHVPVRVDKSSHFDREPTQRSRSFLFASLGAALAVMAGLRRVRFYENGVVAINLPPSAQVVGARASRTAHPQVLSGFGRLFTRLSNGPFEVDNPFLWKTKAEVIALIAAAGCAGLIRHTTSCTHTWEMTREHAHCGTCSQCIDRRFAMLAAGQGEADPADDYAVDLMTGPREKAHDRTMLAVYLETVNQLARMSQGTFLARYGEATRVLRHTDESPEAAALKVFQLYQLHAQGVNEVIDRALGEYAASIRRRNLSPSCLLRLVTDTGGTGAESQESPRAQPPPLPENVFRRKGPGWQVRFAGGEDLFFKPHKGFAYLHLLLSRPNVPISAAELICIVARDPRRFALGNAGERLDRDALSAFEARYRELKEDLEEARDNNDPGTEGKLQAEMAALYEELRKARALHGRIRKDSDDRNRARLAVRAAVRRAVEEIARYDARLAKHLSPPRLRGGWRPCYAPDQEICWET
jgi:hypothetical protein